MPKGGRKFRPFERFLGSFLLRDPMRKHSLCRRVVCLHCLRIWSNVQFAKCALQIHLALVTEKRIKTKTRPILEVVSSLNICTYRFPAMRYHPHETEHKLPPVECTMNLLGVMLPLMLF